MPRMRDRILHPEFFTDAKLYDAEHASGLPLRLAYSGLWCVADREGRFEWKPRELKLGILPYDQVDFGAVLQALVDHGFVTRYVVDGTEVGWIRKFHKWQHVHPKEARSKLPEPPSISVVAPDDPDPVNEVPCNSLELPGIPVVSTSISTSNSNNVAPNGASSNGRVKDRGVKKPRASRSTPTWLSPYGNLWTAGEPPWGQLAKYLHPLVEKYGEAEVLRRWAIYLDATDMAYWSAKRFAETWERWGSKTVPDDGLQDEPDLQWVD